MNIVGEPHRKRQYLPDIIPSDTPFVVFLDICDKCNFVCDFCPCNTSKDAMEIRHKTMPFELFKKIVDDMTGFKRKIRVINLYSYGEPLLNPYFCDMLLYLRNRNVCDEIRTTSNGSLLTKDICEKMVDNGLSMFRLSLYGFSKDEYKRTTHSNVDYDKLISDITYLHAYNQKKRGNLKISTKATSTFINTEETLLKLYNDFADISDYYYVENIDDVWPDFQLIGDYPEVSFAPYKFTKETEQKSLCSFLFTDMAIHSNGDVGVCHLDWKHSTIYGSVVNDSTVDLWNGKALRDLRVDFCRSETPPIEFCRSCKKVFSDNIDEEREKIIKKLTDN